MTEKHTLKPCPFCGKKNISINNGKVQCNTDGCDAESPDVWQHISNIGDNSQNGLNAVALKLWNSRALEEALEQERDDLKEKVKRLTIEKANRTISACSASVSDPERDYVIQGQQEEIGELEQRVKELEEALRDCEDTIESLLFQNSCEDGIDKMMIMSAKRCLGNVKQALKKGEI